MQVVKKLSEILITFPANLIDIEEDIDDRYNYQRYEYEMIKNFDSTPPIKVTADGTLVDGHHRYSCAKFLKCETIDCEIVADDYENTN